MLRDFPLAGASGALVDPARPPVPVRDAATVMLVRPAPPGSAGVEVFTIRRMPRMAFAAGMLAFPGGAVEPQDADPALPWQGPDGAPARGPKGAPALRAAMAAAVRETFEECGVLLAVAADGAPARPPAADPAWEARRQTMIAGELRLADLLREQGLGLRAELLRPWAHWVTPPGETRRFDTRFFVAVVPPGQQARYLAGEAAAASWTAPAAAVAGHAAGQVPMLPPTLVALEELAAAASVPALLATPRRLRPVVPWLARAGGQDVLRVDLDGVGGGEPPVGGGR